MHCSLHVVTNKVASKAKTQEEKEEVLWWDLIRNT